MKRKPVTLYMLIFLFILNLRILNCPDFQNSEIMDILLHKVAKKDSYIVLSKKNKKIEAGLLRLLSFIAYLFVR